MTRRSLLGQFIILLLAVTSTDIANLKSMQNRKKVQPLTDLSFMYHYAQVEIESTIYGLSFPLDQTKTILFIRIPRTLIAGRLHKLRPGK